MGQSRKSISGSLILGLFTRNQQKLELSKHQLSTPIIIGEVRQRHHKTYSSVNPAGEKTGFTSRTTGQGWQGGGMVLPARFPFPRAGKILQSSQEVAMFYTAD